ncbi:MAG: OmpA family protein [Alistipes sp.]|nr:OmpA family protein [Alistipes sp.]
MKSKIAIILACLCLVMSPDVSYAKGGKFWKQLGRLVGKVAVATSAVVVDRAIESCGYTQEEARQYTRDIYDAFGADVTNVERGLAIADSENKYEQMNIAKDYVFDMAKSMSKNQDFINVMQELTDAQLSHLGDKSQATTAEERYTIDTTYIRRYSNLMYDTYQMGKDKKSKYLAKKLKIKKQLIDKGENPEFADELAASILAVQESESFSEQEKRDYYRAYGFIETPEQVAEIADEVLNTDEEQLLEDENAQKELDRLEEERRQQEEERRQQEIEARNRAIAQINETIVGSYVFDQDALADEQKEQLDYVAELLNKYEDLNVELIGHTCKKGYKSVNNRIGLRRAETAKTYLVEKGISEERIETTSKGESEPIIANPTLDELKQNRRVEFQIK